MFKTIQMSFNLKIREPSLTEVMALNKPETLYIIIGCLSCVINGGIQPAFSVVFSKIISVI